ncbi:MAG: ribonuclease H-like domain-containing protein, partial [Polyangiaceae bacterium]|nr:ribonuclease H-like domain-containing protein [Polyangiaceae bacterium]
MEKFLIFDIETIVDAEIPLLALADGQTLPPAPYHQVVAIGALLLVGPELEPRRLGIIGRDSTDEITILKEFSHLVESHRPTLVSYNGRGFDLPVIASRCFRHGIPFPAYYRGRDMRYRFT